MQANRVAHVVSAHADGEVGDVVVGGVAAPPGETLRERSRFIANDERLRNSVLNEPRGGVFRHVNLLVPPIRPEAPVEIRDGVKTGRNAVAIRPGTIDRSPCGTGCSARLAVLHARGELAPGETLAGLSPIDSRFD